MSDKNRVGFTALLLQLIKLALILLAGSLHKAETVVVRTTVNSRKAVNVNWFPRAF
jgi:hypothetical protein